MVKISDRITVPNNIGEDIIQSFVMSFFTEGGMSISVTQFFNQVTDLDLMFCQSLCASFLPYDWWCGVVARLLYYTILWKQCQYPWAKKRGKLQHVRELVSLFSCLIRSPYQVLGYETIRAQVFSGCPGTSPSHTLNHRKRLWWARDKHRSSLMTARKGLSTLWQVSSLTELWMIYSTVILTTGPVERGDGRCRQVTLTALAE